MSVYSARGLAAAIAYVAASQVAHADLTGQDVWSDWKAYMSSAGYTISGEERTSGNVLTIDNMSVSMPMPEENGSFTVTIDGLTFSENPDGTVTVGMPNKVPMTFRSALEGEDPVDGILTFTQTDHRMMASGTPDDLLYTYTAAAADLRMTALTVDGAPVSETAGRVSVTLKNVASSTRMQVQDKRRYTQSMSADSLSYDFAFDDPESEDKGALAGALTGVGFEGRGAIPLAMDPTDFNKMLTDGFEVDGVFAYDSGQSAINGVGDGQSIAFTSASQGGKVAVRMDAAQIAYDLNQEQTSLSLAGSELPFPISMQSALSAFKIAIPVASSDAAQDFSVGLTLSDFTMSEMLWSIFDPAAQLPRDPATLAIDLTGKARVLFDFLDPAVAASLEQSDEAPVELNALSINKLLVSLVGASLSGSGNFTFDNSDLTTFDGIPRPAGQLDLQLVGGNGLLDKLIAMGFVGEQEAMGARMMMGMLAVPGETPDTLNSKLEITEQGHVLANGQRIK
ncbi:DUF2125 domain-containing protein [Sedimentitalea sp. JM2-8]|uniref:DUF2125 domain-containing protein n=1 Tax=Sedimentitalea xiamensis TaxID=3050037 RepID=A0ABT7F916_9RHOB|nr:DUF2125 domain-containing protein [Sedimentitalea xiamensis]MDK3071592.1 DUF2125 domain-containing protein [Sedimentitalea xiamensis]